MSDVADPAGSREAPDPNAPEFAPEPTGPSDGELSDGELLDRVTAVVVQDLVAAVGAVEASGGQRRVWVLNGVNLGRLGAREPLIYGTTTHADLVARLEAVGAELGLVVEVRQTDDEAEMIGWLHAAADRAIPVVLNPAAWSHYSVALHDAVAQRTADLVEVHMSNIAARESFRHHSVVSAVATGVISGLGVVGYELALRFLAGAEPPRSRASQG
jgi:3-dehydroquinate dehydratase-2